MLKTGAEYDTMLQAVSSFYINRSIDATFKEIPQAPVSQIYEEIDSLSNYFDDLIRQKNILETALYNFKNEYKTSLIVYAACEDYFQSYAKVINKMYRINEIAEDIYTSYVLDVVSSRTTTLLPGELKRLVLSSVLYFGEYYYLKHCVLNSDLTSCFGYKKITNSSDEVINNPNFDASFASFQNIVNDIKNIGDTDLNDPDKLTYYNYGIIKLQTLKHSMEDLRIAVQKVSEFQAKHPNEAITSASDVYYYKMFIEYMGSEIDNFQTYLYLHIINDN